ncbi:MAG: NADH-quinone oxidoreductase subunit J [Chloroflexi bacterium]|nr:NADH-quinone oxidoreductase subunit J [Chloroflexota bacterium]
MDSPAFLLAFLILSGITVTSALLVFVARNLMHALAFLVLSFLGMAGLFMTLSADFIAVAQILIYAGSISVLMVFAVMLTPLASRDNGNSLYVIPALMGGAGIAGLVSLVAIETDWAEHSGDALKAADFERTVPVIGDLLLGRYVLAFEVASVLLFIALLGAILLVQDRDGGDATGEAQ